MENEEKIDFQITEFLNALYGNVKQGFISIWTLENKKTKWFHVSKINEMFQQVMQLRHNNNVYFGVGVRSNELGEFKRGKNEDVASLPGVWVEIDLIGGNHAADNLPSEEEANCILNTFPLEPSIIINSGGGIHCYWLFKEPMAVASVSDMHTAETMLFDFQNVFIQLAKGKGFHIDNTSDLARVLRLPGTFNLKSKMNPKLVNIETFEPNRRYCIDEIKDAIRSLKIFLPEEPEAKELQKQYKSQIPDVTNPNHIIRECQFIREYINHKETANYNEWMAALSIAAFCENGEALVHEWSKGHHDYQEQVVVRKYNEIRLKMKPRTCRSIQQEFGRCYGCRHFNKINSPIVFGMERKKTLSLEQTNFKRTDIGNAERLVYQYGSDIKYNNTFGKWYLWDGRRWSMDKIDRIFQFAKNTVRGIYEEALNADDSDTRTSLAQHALRSESRSRIEAMVSLAKSEVPILPDEMDQDEWLFNCANGVIDLKTGELRPHKREYMITKLSTIVYSSKAECPTWLKFLNDIFQDEQGNVKQDIIDFLQKAVGYALTGDTREQVLFFLVGEGRNGKSTFVNVIKDILGEYGMQTNAETFTVKKSERVNNDIAALKGARFVAATESEEGARLAESLVKQLTGGESVQARFLHQEFFEYVPQFKLFFTTNHKPIIAGADEGIWRRILQIPFTITIPKEKVDKELPLKLKNEMPGILRWVVEGCMKWQKEGLGVPQEVLDATDSYRNEMDEIGNFMKECCSIHEDAKSKCIDIYNTYSDWCTNNGDYELTKNKFYRKLVERGFKKKISTGGYPYFFGIGIKPLFINSCKVVSSGQKNDNLEININTAENGEKSQLHPTYQLSGEKVVPLLI